MLFVFCYLHFKMGPRIIISARLRGALQACAAGGVIFVGANLFFGSERFYEETVMPCLRLIDSETVHRLSIQAAKYGLVPRCSSVDDPILHSTVWNRHFKNPLGLAAGFDKNGEAIEGLTKIGFSFIEIGTVTPKPQPGNDKPRVFRLTEDRAIINRYGFNNDGYETVRDRLIAYRRRRNANQNDSVLIGVNIGRNKSTTTAVEHDYTLGIEQFGCLADYLVVNISSPNTPGLRALQAETELERLLSSVRSVSDKISCQNERGVRTGAPPLLLKVAPDLNENEIKSIAQVVRRPATRVDGLIISNTTIERPDSLKSEQCKETGGLSGRPLKEKALETLRSFRRHTQGQIPLIGVGGIETAEDILKRIKAGACLVQIYTSLTYSGPPLVNKLNRELAHLMRKENIAHLHDAIGRDTTT